MPKEYIDRELAVNAIVENPYNMAVKTARAIKAIENIPAADVVEVVHGEWEYCSETATLRAHYWCTNCKRPRYEHYAYNNFKYCPNCGAKMDGERRKNDD